QEIIDLSLTPFPANISPLRPGAKRKQAPTSPRNHGTGDVIDLITPPRVHPKIEPDSKPELPRRNIQPDFGRIRVGTQFESMDEAITAVYSHQENLGHKWVLGQSWKNPAGVLKKRTLRCNRYREATPAHRIDLDPSDHRRGKSAKTQCMAHVNVNRLPGSTDPKWYLTTVDLEHNHDREIPIGGVASRPPTQAHRHLVSSFADSFSRPHLKKILRSHFPENRLEDRQISNMLNDARREAREHVASLGG
ncbi:hypothetical protein DFH07DRAFT_712013, partial [Mycena maculata]